VSPSTWLEGIHQEDRERVTRAMLTKQARGEYDEEYRVVRPDGSLRWVHDRAFPVRDEKGMIYRLVGIAEDITERKRAESLLRAQRDVGIALSFTNDLDYALERLLGVAVQFEGIECGGIYLMDQDTGELHLRAHRGLSGSFVRRIQHYRADATETRLARAGHIVYVRHDQIPRSLEVLWGSEGLRALAIVPIQHKGVVVGMLNLGSYRQDEIPPKIRLGIEMIASQFAGAIARIRAEDLLRRSERQILEISDREQAHIGQDIHDGLCQQLVGIAFDANALEESLNAAAPDQARLARRIAMMLDEAISESRRVARGLYPVRLETEGLVPALKDLANRTSERFKIRCFCETAAPEFVCDATTGTHLYRIAQEAVNNALKHSGAGRVSIQLAEQNGQIELRVGDDGKGIEPGRPRTAGMGLYIMDYRARSMGGALRVHPGPDGGTVVTCTVPRKTL
jgi:signal transduction histidine kinase